MKQFIAGVLLALSAGAATPTVTPTFDTLETDWLLQCDNKPRFQKIDAEIKYARDMAKRIQAMPNAPDLTEELKKLDALELEKRKALVDRFPLAQKYYIQVRRIKRAIMFKNPLIDFKQILLIDNPYPTGDERDWTREFAHEARHRNGYMAKNGGGLIVLSMNKDKVVLSGDPEAVDLFKLDKGSYWRPDLSFDGKRILYSYKPERERSFHLYECNLDGSDRKQLTFGDYDDLDPIYLPDGKIAFTSSRNHSYIRCFPCCHSFVLARCDADGKNIYLMSANNECDFMPVVMNDGRLVFARWEYTDKALWRVQSLWTSDPDGCNIQTLWGSQSIWPDMLVEARPIPNSTKIMFVATGHHSYWEGSIGMIDPAKGLNYPDGLERITRDIPWPETGNGPKDPPNTYGYHEAGIAFHAYKTPYPLSEELFLVSAREGEIITLDDRDDTHLFRLYLMDVYGNKELLYTGKYNALHALPIKSRPVPPVLVDKVKWPELEPGDGTWQSLMKQEVQPVTFYSNDVFENAPEVLRKNGKYLRVVQMDPKNYTTYNKTVNNDGPAVSMFQAEGVKRILGTIPIEADGSVNFEVPAGESLFFQILDAEGMAIHVMRTFTYGMPGEHRGCFGCHETSMKTRTSQASSLRKKGTALTKPAVKLTQPAWGAKESIGYKRFVQPVLDKHCAACHQKPGTEAYKKLNMTWRPGDQGWLSWGGGWVYERDDVVPFYEPYRSFADGFRGWSYVVKDHNSGVPPVSRIGGLFLVEGFERDDPDSLATLPPYSAFSPKSMLVQNAVSGNHHGVKVTGVDRERLIAWVDCNGPFLGDEEVRSQFYDPYSWQIENIPLVRPRVATAPRINRFNLRQDGNVNALCGPLKLMPNRVPGFDPNKELQKILKVEAEKRKAAEAATGNK